MFRSFCGIHPISSYSTVEVVRGKRLTSDAQHYLEDRGVPLVRMMQMEAEQRTGSTREGEEQICPSWLRTE